MPELQYWQYMLLLLLLLLFLIYLFIWFLNIFYTTHLAVMINYLQYMHESLSCFFHRESVYNSLQHKSKHNCEFLIHV